MDINAASLEAMFKTYLTIFQKGVSWKPPVDIGFMFFESPSTSAANFYAWLEQIPSFRQWVGDRVFRNIQSGNFQVTNLPFEDSVSIDKDKIDDDLFGVYAPLVGMMGEAWARRKYKLVIDVLTGNPTCMDGKAIFATDHAYGSNTIANLVTDALSKTAFEAAFTTGSAYKYANDELVGTSWTHLVHGPKLHATAFAIVDAENYNDGTTTVPNPNYKRVQRVELPDIAGTYDDYWFLLDCSSTVKPIVRQIRREAQILMDTNPATVMRTGRVDVMGDGRAAAAPSFPHMMYAGIL